MDLVELMASKKQTRWKTDSSKSKIIRVSSAVLTQHRVKARPRSFSKNSSILKSMASSSSSTTMALSQGSDDDSIESLLRKVETVQFLPSKDKKVDMKKTPSIGIQIVRDFLKKAIQQADITPNTLEIKWAKLFQQRMIENSSILSSRRIETLNSVIASYTKQEFTGTTYWEVGNSLASYLQTHHFDPENSIIGLKCKPSILGEFQSFASHFLESQKIFGNEIWNVGESKEENNGNTHATQPSHHHDIINHNVVQFDIEVKKSHIYEFVQKILSGNEETEQKLLKIEKFMQFCCSCDKLIAHWPEKIIPGNILVVAIPSDKFHSYDAEPKQNPISILDDENLICKLQKIQESDQEDIYQDLPLSPGTSSQVVEFRFMRFTGGYDRESRFLYAFTDGNEAKIEKLPIHCCIPFPSSWNMNFGSKKSMIRLIENPEHILFLRLANYLKESLDKLLQSKQIDIELLERLIIFDIEVSESSQIHSLLHKLQTLQIEFPKQFLTKMNQISQRCKNQFNESKLIHDMFYPTKQNNLTDLEGICMETLIQKRLVKLVSYGQQSLEYIESQKKLVVNGTKKQEITNWWLQVIENHVKQFLQSISYHFSAVRYDYIETPPDDLDAVRQNLIKVQCILDRKTDPYHVQDLLDKIKSIVYPKIDSFIKNAKIAICDKLSIQENEFSIEKCLKIIQNHSLAPSSSSSSSIDFSKLEDLLKDIEYLETIKRLELQQENEKKNLNVVPISGLVMGSFYRLENELKTVLEVWDPTWKLTKQNLSNNNLMKRGSAEKRVTMMLASRSESIRQTTHSILNPEDSSSSPRNSLDSNLSSNLLNLKIKTSASSLNHSTSEENENKRKLQSRNSSVCIDFDDFCGELELDSSSPSIHSEDPIPLSESKEENQDENRNEEEKEKFDGPDENKESVACLSDNDHQQSAGHNIEDAVVMISVDDIMENLNQLESLSRKGSVSRLYAADRQNKLEDAKRHKPGSNTNASRSRISIKKIFKPK